MPTAENAVNTCPSPNMVVVTSYKHGINCKLLRSQLNGWIHILEQGIVDMGFRKEEQKQQLSSSSAQRRAEKFLVHVIQAGSSSKIDKKNPKSRARKNQLI